MASAPELPKETRRGTVAGRDFGQLLRQRHQFFVIEIGAGHVDQARGLLLDGLHHARMAMAGRDHRDSGVEIEKTIAVHILHHGAFAALRHQRIAARIGRRNGAVVALDHGARARAGHRADDLGQVRADQFHGTGHTNLLIFSCGV